MTELEQARERYQAALDAYIAAKRAEHAAHVNARESGYPGALVTESQRRNADRFQAEIALENAHRSLYWTMAVEALAEVPA